MYMLTAQHFQMVKRFIQGDATWEEWRTLRDWMEELDNPLSRQEEVELKVQHQQFHDQVDAHSQEELS